MNDRITKQDKIDAWREEQLKRKGKASGASSYYQQALVDLGLENSTGRFTSKPVVTGSEPGVHVPRLPASSPWAGDPVPPEEPLGYSINDLEVIGTPAEVERSIAEQELGEPAGAITQGTHPPSRFVEQLSESAVQAGSPPSVDRGSAPLTSPQRVLTQETSPVLSTSRSTLLDAPDEVPDDGLDDCPRREDGTPMSHTMKRRKI